MLLALRSHFFEISARIGSADTYKQNKIIYLIHIISNTKTTLLNYYEIITLQIYNEYKCETIPKCYDITR